MRMQRREEKNAHSVTVAHDWVDIVCRAEKTGNRQQPLLDVQSDFNDGWMDFGATDGRGESGVL